MILSGFFLGQEEGEGVGEGGQVVAFGAAVADLDVVGADSEGAKAAGEGAEGEE